MATEKQISLMKKKMIPVLQKHDVKKAALFGSVARREATKGSDIDLLIEFAGKKSLMDLVGLKLELQDVMGAEVDVITYKSLHPLLKKRILGEQEVILSKTLKHS